MASDEELLQCPYNVTHMVLKSRMPSHLIKCRHQYPIERYLTCPLNATHDVPEPELQYHVKTCPDRNTVEKSIYVMEEPKPLDYGKLTVDVPDCSENWDEEKHSGSSYLNVKEDLIEKNLILRQPVGKSKAERKAFVDGEIKKFGEDKPPFCPDLSSF